MANVRIVNPSFISSVETLYGFNRIAGHALRGHSSKAAASLLLSTGGAGSPNFKPARFKNLLSFVKKHLIEIEMVCKGPFE